MDVLDCIKEMIKKSGVSQSALANAMGRSRQSVYNMFRDKTDVHVDTLTNMAEIMGYKLMLCGKDDEMVVTPREEIK